MPIASYRKYSKTIPNCVLAKFQLRLIENILKECQIISIILPGPLNENSLCNQLSSGIHKSPLCFDLVELISLIIFS